jgi:hypothetical protein
VAHDIRPIQARAGGTKVILRAQILEAQRHTNSNAAAARYLQVDYDTYRKYARLYELYDSHSNQRGKGIDKGWSKKPTSIPINDILAGKHPTYNLQKLKNRLLARNIVPAHCMLCNFYEERFTDKKAPLLLTFKEQQLPNPFELANLLLLCYNCFFLTQGSPSIAHAYPHTLQKSLRTPHMISARQHELSTPTHADQFDPHDHLLTPLTLTDEEKALLLSECTVAIS